MTVVGGGSLTAPRSSLTTLIDYQSISVDGILEEAAAVAAAWRPAKLRSGRD
jgi:hypothetical protein